MSSGILDFCLLESRLKIASPTFWATPIHMRNAEFLSALVTLDLYLDNFRFLHVCIIPSLLEKANGIYDLFWPPMRTRAGITMHPT